MEGKESKPKKHTLRGAAKAVSLAAKLSPKSQRKKEKMASTTAQLKVRPGVLEIIYTCQLSKEAYSQLGLLDSDHSFRSSDDTQNILSRNIFVP